MKSIRLCALISVGVIASFVFGNAASANDNYLLPPIPTGKPAASEPNRAGYVTERAEKPEYAYGIGYAAPWQPVSGKHWRKGARLEYYSNPPAPTWRWFTTGRGCPYDPGLHYGIGYPFSVGYTYPKYKREP